MSDHHLSSDHDSGSHSLLILESHLYQNLCSGSVVVTTYDFESGGPGSSPEWGQYTIRLRSLHRAYSSLHPFGVVHWVPEQLNIKAVTGACKLIGGSA